MRSPWNLRVNVSKCSQEVITVASKTENTVQHAIGWSSIQVPSRTLATKLCGWRVELCSPVWAHAPNFSVTDCDMFIERKLSSIGSILHVYIEEEEWEFISRIVIDGKESETECTINLRAHFLEFEVCRGNARSGFLPAHGSKI